MENLSIRKQEIFTRLDQIHEQMEKACSLAGRPLSEVNLMAVTKTVEPERVNMAIEYGVRYLGENRAQELTAKFEDYHKENVDIHFIGHLQTNKVRQIIDKVSLIQSVDSLRLAQEISRLATDRLGHPMDILVEINIGGEESKSGIPAGQVMQLVADAAQLPGIRVKGLMCIPPICEDTCTLENYFDQMHQLFVDIGEKSIDNVTMDILSMGMSGDYFYAIKHGANLIRLGSAIFGKRNV